MPGTPVYIESKPVLDFDDKAGSSIITQNTNGTKLAFSDGNTFFRTRTGRRGFLTFVGNSVTSGGEDLITFHILINGNRIACVPFDKFTQALGETYNGWARQAARIEIPQNALVEVSADNSSNSTDYTAYVRLRIEYEELN